MRELVVEGQEAIIIPSNYKFANRGVITAVSAGDFTLELEKEPENILPDTYFEIYTQTKHGKLYFDSYAKKINGKTLLIASPAKHKFLQRRQYTRIKFMHDLEIKSNAGSINISTLDISAGGMKIHSADKIDIGTVYEIEIPISETKNIKCSFDPIRIEKAETGGYTVSGQFKYESSYDKMLITQYCAKRNVELKNK